MTRRVQFQVHSTLNVETPSDTELFKTREKYTAQFTTGSKDMNSQRYEIRGTLRESIYNNFNILLAISRSSARV